MAQKTNPISLRLQYTNRYFDNSWYSKQYYDKLITKDIFIQKYINTFLKLLKLPSGRFSIQHLPKKTRLFNFFCYSKKSREIRSKMFGVFIPSFFRKRKFLKKNKQPNSTKFWKGQKVVQKNYVFLQPKHNFLAQGFNNKKFQNSKSNLLVQFLYTKKLWLFPKYNLITVNYFQPNKNKYFGCRAFFAQNRQVKSYLTRPKHSFSQEKNGNSFYLVDSYKQPNNVKQNLKQNINYNDLFVKFIINLVIQSKLNSKKTPVLTNFKNKNKEKSSLVCLDSSRPVQSNSTKESKSNFYSLDYTKNLFKYFLISSNWSKNIYRFQNIKKFTLFETKLMDYLHTIPKESKLFLEKARQRKALNSSALIKSNKKINLKSSSLNNIKQTATNQEYLLSRDNVYHSNGVQNNQIFQISNDWKFSNLDNKYKYKNYLQGNLAGIYNLDFEFIPFIIKNDWQSAGFIAEEIVYFLERRVPFRRIKTKLLKQISENSNIRGIRITCSGRVGGKSKKAQRAKTECVKLGQTSLHVFSSQIDFAVRTAQTSFGSVGIKVWVSYN